MDCASARWRENFGAQSTFLFSAVGPKPNRFSAVEGAGSV